MIFSSYEIGEEMKQFPAPIQKAVEYATKTDFTGMADGRHEIPGCDPDEMFGQLWHTTTKPKEEIRPELHRKYLDVQIWLEGEEVFGVAPAENIGNLVEALEPRDLYLYDDIQDESYVRTRKGCFAVFFPTDAHRPGICADGTYGKSVKVVVKIRRDLIG